MQSYIDIIYIQLAFIQVMILHNTIQHIKRFTHRDVDIIHMLFI